MILQKGVYLYEYLDDWEDIQEICLNVKDITDADYKYSEIVWEEYALKTKVNITIYTFIKITDFWQLICF